MEFGILGPLEVHEQRKTLKVRGDKQKALLAILLLNANLVVSSDRLIDELWAGNRSEGGGHSSLQVLVSKVRKALGGSGAANPIVTRSPGYVIHVETEHLDLLKFERLLGEGRRALEDGSPEPASATLNQALALWRGAALADFLYEEWAQAAIARLEELRLAALELRVEADLTLGRQRELVGELERLVAENPLREGLRAQLMLALYRSGRQAEALGTYQEGRAALVEELGIEPGPSLQELERAILQQDPTLERDVGPTEPGLGAEHPERSLLVLPQNPANFGALLALAAPLARTPPRELILAELVAADDELADASARVLGHRTQLAEGGLTARAAAFTTDDRGKDSVRFAVEQAVDLLLFDAPAGLVDTGLPPEDVGTVLTGAPSDVAILVVREDRQVVIDPDHPVFVPFSGADDDWSAVELAAWVAKAESAPLRLAGAKGDPETGRRDASRLLARASILVQRMVDVAAEPALVPPGEEALLEASENAGLVVLGLASHQRHMGLGGVRLALARHARPPTLLIRKGLRPGGLAPPETLTRFTWSIAQRQ